MHNWWLATMEEVGLLTKEEAAHISLEIRSKIHKEDYEGASREIRAILNKSKLGDNFNKFDKLKGDVLVAKQKISDLEEEIAKLKPAQKETIAKIKTT